MNFFSDVMEVAFQTDSESRTLFFPWGVISKGYVLPDAGMERRVKTFYKYYYLAGLVVVILGLVLLGWPGAVGVGVLAFLWYVIQINVYLRQCEVGDVSVREHMQDIARKYNLVALWFLFAFCLLVTLFGGFLVVLGELLAGIVFLLIFGLIAGMYGTLLRLRNPASD